MEEVKQSALQPTEDLPVLKGHLFTPIPGQDYLVDHYAILQVPRFSDRDTCHKAFRKLSAEWHPDKYAALAKPMREQAEVHTKLLNEADFILGNPGRKETYDGLLKDFPPGLISTDGVPIINLQRRRIDLEMLTSARERDMSEYEKKLKSLSGFDEATYNLLCKLVNVDPNPSDQLKAALRDATEKRLTYLTIKEEATWEKYGVSNQGSVKGTFSPEDHIEARRTQIEEFKQEVVTSIQNTARLIGEQRTLKLLHAGGEPTEDVSAALITEKVTAKALARIVQIESQLLSAATETADAIKMLLVLTEWHYDPETPAKLTDNLVVVILHNGIVLSGIQCKNVAGVVNGDPLEPGRGLQKDEGIAALRAAVEPDATFATVKLNPELEIMMQVSFVLQKHMERYTGGDVGVTRRPVKE